MVAETVLYQAVNGGTNESSQTLNLPCSEQSHDKGETNMTRSAPAGRRKIIKLAMALGMGVVLALGLTVAYLAYRLDQPPAGVGEGKPAVEEPAKQKDPPSSAIMKPNFGRGGWEELQSLGIRPDIISSVQWGVATASYQIEGAVAQDGYVIVVGTVLYFTCCYTNITYPCCHHF